MCKQKITKHALSLWFQLCISVLIKKKKPNRSPQKNKSETEIFHK